MIELKFITQKRFWFSFLSVMTLMFACSLSSDKSTKGVEQKQSNNEQVALNNGLKWKSDSTTEINVANLKTIAGKFKIKKFPSVDDYRILNTDLKNGFNQLIQQCRMTGPDHEALHHWLEPLLEENKKIEKIIDTTGGAKIFKTIEKQFDDYHNYFE